MSQRRKTVLILDNIRSVHNVGSIFRTADAFAVLRIYCVGTTPTPLDRFGRARADFAKVSLGAEQTVKWEHTEAGLPVIDTYRAKGFFIAALEQGSGSISVSALPKGKHILLILGSETEGISQNLLEGADVLAEIPMRGSKESLNVSVAAGIALAYVQGV